MAVGFSGKFKPMSGLFKVWSPQEMQLSGYAAWIDRHPTKYYVETTGNDTTGDGSQGSPWATLTKAVTEAEAGSAIVLGAGTFDTTGTEDNPGGGFLTDLGKDLHFYGDPGNTTIQTVTTTQRDSHLLGLSHPGSTMQGIIGFHNYKLGNAGRGTTYSRALLSASTGNPVKGLIRNCAFYYVDDESGSMFYNNSSNNDIVVKNTSFRVDGWGASHSGAETGSQFVDTAFETSYPDTSGVTRTNLIEDATFNATTYSITSGSGTDSTHGVYSGSLSWSTPGTPAVIKATSTPVSGHDFISWFPTDETSNEGVISLYRDIGTGLGYDLGNRASVTRTTVGSNDSIKSAASHTVPIIDQTYTSYTVSLWVNNTYSGGTTGGWSWRGVRIGNEWFLVYRDGKASDGYVYSPNNNVTRYKSTNSMTTYNGVHQCVWVRDGVDCTYYVNGNLEGTFSGGNIPSASLSSSYTIHNNGAYTNGNMSRINVSIFDGAMDATDVSTLYSAGVDALSDRSSY